MFVFGTFETLSDTAGHMYNYSHMKQSNKKPLKGVKHLKMKLANNKPSLLDSHVVHERTCSSIFCLLSAAGDKFVSINFAWPNKQKNGWQDCSLGFPQVESLGIHFQTVPCAF